ncbi:unnamed protein product, partial [Discosporangium mesarthrocarpum]
DGHGRVGFCSHHLERHPREGNKNLEGVMEREAGPAVSPQMDKDMDKIDGGPGTTGTNLGGTIARRGEEGDRGHRCGHERASREGSNVDSHGNDDSGVDPRGLPVVLTEEWTKPTDKGGGRGGMIFTSAEATLDGVPH